MRRLSRWLSVPALLLGAPAAQAQITASSPDSLAGVVPRWLFGGRVGAAVSFYRSPDNLSNGSNSHIGPAASVLGGYYVRPLRVWLVAEPGYEQRRLPESDNTYSYAELPLYLRTARILDPARGSGSFLLAAVGRLTQLHPALSVEDH